MNLIHIQHHPAINLNPIGLSLQILKVHQHFSSARSRFTDFLYIDSISSLDGRRAWREKRWDLFDWSVSIRNSFKVTVGWESHILACYYSLADMTARQKSSGCAGSSLQPKRANKNFRQTAFHMEVCNLLICLQRVIFSFPFFNLFALIRDLDCLYHLGTAWSRFHSLWTIFQIPVKLGLWLCDHSLPYVTAGQPLSNPEACFMVRLGKLQKQRRVPRRKLEQFEVTKVRCSWRQRQKAYASYESYPFGLGKSRCVPTDRMAQTGWFVVAWTCGFARQLACSEKPGWKWTVSKLRSKDRGILSAPRRWNDQKKLVLMDMMWHDTWCTYARHFEICMLVTPFRLASRQPSTLCITGRSSHIGRLSNRTMGGLTISLKLWYALQVLGISEMVSWIALFCLHMGLDCFRLKANSLPFLQSDAVILAPPGLLCWLYLYEHCVSSATCERYIAATLVCAGAAKCKRRCCTKARRASASKPGASEGMVKAFMIMHENECRCMLYAQMNVSDSKWFCALGSWPRCSRSKFWKSEIQREGQRIQATAEMKW